MPGSTPTDDASMRRRLADARATLVGTKGLRAKVARQASAIAGLRTRAEEDQRRLARLEQQVKELGRASTLDSTERERRDTQFGTMEVRVADLEQRLSDAASGLADATLDDHQLTTGRGLLDEVRTEHARIRARMQVVSSYEERLRRVEESVARLFEGDRRHPV